MVTGDWPQSALFPTRWPQSVVAWPWLSVALPVVSSVLIVAIAVLGVAVPGVIIADVEYDRTTPTIKRGYLTFLTLDVKSSRPNDPVFVDMIFYNSLEVPLSTSHEFICWGEFQFSTQLNANLTVLGMASRKGLLVTQPAEDLFGNRTTLLGIVEQLDGPTRRRVGVHPRRDE